MSVPCLYLRCSPCNSSDEQHVWFFPSMETPLPVVPICSWFLCFTFIAGKADFTVFWVWLASPRGFAHSHQHPESLRYLFVQGSLHICPPERVFRPQLSSEGPWTSFLHLDYTAQMPISFISSKTRGFWPPGSPNFISFSLQSQDSFSVELLLLALRYMACQICLNDFLVPIITRRNLTGSVQSI